MSFIALLVPLSRFLDRLFLPGQLCNCSRFRELKAVRNLSVVARKLTIAVVAIASCLFVFGASTGPANASSLLSGYAALKQTAAESVPYSVAVADRKPAIVEFYADWCSVCRAMAPTMAELHDRYGERVDFVMLDIDDPQWSGQVREFRVVGVPYFAFVSSDLQGEGDRQVVQTLIGRHPEAIVVDAIEQLLES